MSMKVSYVLKSLFRSPYPPRYLEITSHHWLFLSRAGHVNSITTLDADLVWFHLQSLGSIVLAQIRQANATTIM